MAPNILLSVVLDVVQNLFPIIFLFVPLDHIECALLLLQPLKHLLVLKYNIFMIPQSFFKIERLL